MHTSRHFWSNLFFFTLFASLAFHLNEAPHQYQELDSILALKTIRHSAKEPVYIKYMDSVYPLRPMKHVGKVLQSPALLSIARLWKPGITPEALGLLLRNPLHDFRRQLTVNIDRSDMPQWLKAFFLLPFGTTYSALPGALYGFLTPSPSINDLDQHAIMATRATQVAFHLGVLFFFLFLCRVRSSPPADTIASLCMLGSISLYSYGYHLGSTVWNFSTSACWLWVLAAMRGRKLGEFWTAVATGILLFANYLIAIYWLAYFLVKIGSLVLTGDWMTATAKCLRKVALGLAMQLPALASLTVVSLLFLQEGEGIRGASQISTLGEDLCYAILNFFAFYRYGWIVAIELIMFGGLTLVGMVRLAGWAFSHDRAVERTALAILMVYIVFVYPLKRLTFMPSRHLLFLAPIAFLVLAIGLDAVSIVARRWFRRGLPGYWSQGLAIFFVMLGGVAVYRRTKETRWPLQPSAIAEILTKYKVKNVVVRQDGYFAERQWPVPTVSYDWQESKLPEQNYAYLSHELEFQIPAQLIPAGWHAETLFEQTVADLNIYATAFVPLPRERFAFTRPYHLYFKIYRIVPSGGSHRDEASRPIRMPAL